MEKGDLTYRINGCAITVHNKLKRGFMEYVYCRALAIELKREGIQFEREVWLPIHYDNLKIAWRRCDFYCQQAVVVEIKAKAILANEDIVQAINTLERLNVKDGLLINFGADSLQYKHIFNNKYRSETEFQNITPEQVGESDEDTFESRHYLPSWLVEKIQRDKLRGQKV
jgi:GxxExxY protein